MHCESDACGLCNRLDIRQDVGERTGEGMAVTYLDDYCVVTKDSPSYVPADGLLVGFVGHSCDDGMFVTMVFRVGSEGPVSAILEGSDTEVVSKVRYTEYFGSCKDIQKLPGGLEGFPVEHVTEMFMDKHDTAVLGVQSGLIS